MLSVYVCDCMCVFVCETRGRQTENVEKGKGKVGTSVERAPGQKVEAQSTKITALEYESKASGTLVT